MPYHEHLDRRERPAEGLAFASGENFRREVVGEGVKHLGLVEDHDPFPCACHFSGRIETHKPAGDLVGHFSHRRGQGRVTGQLSERVRRLERVVQIDRNVLRREHSRPPSGKSLPQGGRNVRDYANNSWARIMRSATVTPWAHLTTQVGHRLHFTAWCSADMRWKFSRPSGNWPQPSAYMTKRTMSATGRPW